MLLILDLALWLRPPRAKPPRLSDWVGSCAPRTLIKIDQATPPRDKIKLIQGQSSLIKARQGFPKNRESSLDIKPSPFSQYPFPSALFCVLRGQAFLPVSAIPKSRDQSLEFIGRDPDPRGRRLSGIIIIVILISPPPAFQLCSLCYLRALLLKFLP